MKKNNIQTDSVTLVAETPDSKQDKMYLIELQNSHSLWKNPFLTACEIGNLELSDFKILFSQYYFFSKNFTKLIAAYMINCDSDYARSKLSINLWEESGCTDIRMRHAELFREFLTETLEISLDDINYESYTEYFFNQYLDLCLNSNPIESLAALSIGTEGIVPRLYTLLVKGLTKIGILEKDLTFFTIHISCDDEHSITLEEILFSQRNKKNWLDDCKNGINKALNLRNNFFNNIYKDIKFSRFSELMHRIEYNSDELQSDNDNMFLKYRWDLVNNPLYRNQDSNKRINFSVERVNFHADVLDSRVVNIPSGFSNELHSHAHETVFLILEGTGKVIVGDTVLPISAGDIVFVPRWLSHQTKNTGECNLKFFAVTDYGFTKRLSTNSETAYRLNKHNVMGSQTERCTIINSG